MRKGFRLVALAVCCWSMSGAHPLLKGVLQSRQRILSSKGRLLRNRHGNVTSPRLCR